MAFLFVSCASYIKLNTTIKEKHNEKNEFSRKSTEMNLVLLIFLTLSLGGLDSDLLVILLESGKILTGLRELSLFHTLTDVPVNEGTLGVHEIELVVDSGEHLGNSRGVGDHAHGTLHLGEISTGNDGRRLVVDTALETSRGPVNELDGSLGLDGSNGSVDILGHNISSVHETAGHVLSVTGIALDHGGSGLEDGVGDLRNRELLVVRLLSRDDRSVRGKHEMNSRVRHKIGLELGDIDVKGTVESEGRSQGRDNLGNESVKIRVRGSLDVQGTSADIVDGLVIKHDGNIGVLEKSVRGKHAIVGLYNGSGNLRTRVDAESKLGLLTVVDGKSLGEKSSKTGSRSSSNGVEDEESLKTGTLIGELSHTIENEIDDLLTDGVVSTSVVIRGILLSGDELLGMVQLSVRSRANLVYDGGLEIDENTSGNVLSGSGLGEEGVESIITSSDGLVRGHLSVRLDSVLKAVEFPTGVTDLNTGLSYMNRDNFAHLIVLYSCDENKKLM